MTQSAVVFTSEDDLLPPCERDEPKFIEQQRSEDVPERRRSRIHDYRLAA